MNILRCIIPIILVLGTRAQIFGKSEITQWGPATGLGDDSPSSIKCPGDTKAISCTCDNLNNCDTHWIQDSATTCLIRHSAGKPVARPRAVCADVKKCNIIDAYIVVATGGRWTYSNSPSLSVTCPQGMQVVSCGLMYPWKQSEPDTRAVEAGTTGCKLNKPCKKGRGCRIQAVCAASVIKNIVETEWGPATAERDDAPSSVACPPGKKLISCGCDDFNNCDAYWNKWGKCTVLHSAGRPVVKPRAVCADIVKYKSKCKGAETLYKVVETKYTRNPAISCPEGMKAYFCGLHYEYKHKRGAIDTRAIKDGTGGCKVNKPCMIGRGCRVQAICLIHL